jgi:MFS family permease
MVKDFVIVDHENQIGYYAGFLAASFPLSQFITGLGWGFLSDRYGRRNILLIGLLSNAITMSCFGLSKRFLWAIVSRMAGGFMNGNMGIAKSILADITDSSNRALAFSLLGLMWGLGMIAGPIFGGFFSDPVRQFPQWVGSSVFLKTYPYFLPCFISSCVSMLSFIITLLFLPETAPRYGSYQFLLDVETEDVDSQENATIPPAGSSHLIFSHSNNASVSDIFKSLTLSNPSPVEQIWDAASEGIDVGDDEAEYLEPVSINPLAIQTIGGYALVSLQNVVFEELFSVWAVAPVDNGLALHPHQIGSILSIMGALTIVFQLLVYPILSKQWTPYRIYQVTLPLFLIIWIGIPSLVYIAREPSRKYLISSLTILMGLRRFAIVATYTSMNILITHAATEKTMGVVNGLAQTVVSLIRGIGPIIGGSMWSWSITHSAGFLSYYTVYLLLCLLTIAAFIHSFYIKPIPKFEIVVEDDR